jgi:hypothetical protein
MGLVACAITFFIFLFLIEHFPGLIKLIAVMFLVSLAALIVNPATGAVVTLCCLGVLAFLAFLVAIPLFLSWLAGFAFIALLCIGLGQLVK